MKKRYFYAAALSILIAEIAALIIFAAHTPEFSLNAVEVNEAVQSVTRDLDNLQSHVNATPLDYVVLDSSGNVLFATRAGLNESINNAVINRDVILDLTEDGKTVGKLIIYNDGAEKLRQSKLSTVIILSVFITVEGAVCIIYAAYMHMNIIKPFNKLRYFAGRVAGGNLDIPLEMDRQNIFGAFTESFDIMRSELKKARLAEAKANADKKELVAKLSHDIKTPVASIKAVSEVGLAVSSNEKDRANYKQIIGKADQINTLVTNLFTATLEELQQLTVNPSTVESGKIKTLLKNANYLNRADIPDIPECLVYADTLRLQQVFDNIFANSYKYANTHISVSVLKRNDSLHIITEDYGGGVPAEELPVLKEKFKRGSNSVNTEGAGLGLYISDYFMSEMHGGLNIENGSRGLKVTVIISLNGNI